VPHFFCTGTIRCSNLCTEIIEYTSKDEIAVCNLASVALPMFVKKTAAGSEFDHQRLYEVVYVMAKNLNRVIDINYVSTQAHSRDAPAASTLC